MHYFLEDFDSYAFKPVQYHVDDEARSWAEISRTSASEDLKLLELKSTDRMLDLGCGAGFHAIAAAQICRHVYAIDKSAAMIERARENANRLKLKNVTFSKGSILRLDRSADEIGCVFSWGVFHYLPDFWKGIAFKRLGENLLPGTRFLLMDLAYACPVQEADIQARKFLAEIESTQGGDVAVQATRALNGGFPTFTWILTGLLDRAGFEVEVEQHDEFLVWCNFLATKR